MNRYVLPLCFVSLLAHADWPQWRGPDRNGVSSDSTPIVNTLPAEGFTKVWESIAIPSNDYGGHASPVVQGEQVIMSVVWHERVPSEERIIDQETMQKFNHRGLPADLSAKMEAARESLSPRMRGEKLEAWIEEWNKANLNAEQMLSLASWTASRFKAGKSAIPMKWLDKVAARQDKAFANADAVRAWLKEEAFPEDIAQQVFDKIPNTVMQAKDVILCLNLLTGKEAWRWEQPGTPSGRRSSTTPAIVDGRIYSMLSTEVVCVNQADGKLLWKAPMSGKGPGSSPLVMAGKVFCNAGRTFALDAQTGKQLWEQKEARGDVSSPTWWTPSTGKSTVVVQTNNALLGLAPDDGSVQWKVEGGAMSTPVTQGDWIVIYSGTKDVGLRGYKADATGKPESKWSHFWMTRRYVGSPIIHDGLVYAMCGEKHLCVDLETGKKRWEEVVNSTISSPLLVDGKLIIQENNGSHLRFIKADPTSYQMLGRAKADAMSCATPAVSNGRLIVRQKDKLVCFDVREK